MFCAVSGNPLRGAIAHTVEWNRRLEGGGRAAPGVCRVRLQAGGEFRDARLVIVR